jgi:hypothetical protein
VVRLIAMTLLAAGLVVACATPDVVQVQQPRDRELSCAGLLTAIEDADRFESEARHDRGVTGTNVAAAVFFWPALAGTFMNTDEAIDAARRRREHLNRLYTERSCTASSVAASPSSAPSASQDVCVQARADWESIQSSTSLAVVRAYRESIPSACVVQRTLADERMTALETTPASTR